MKIFFFNPLYIAPLDHRYQIYQKINKKVSHFAIQEASLSNFGSYAVPKVVTRWGGVALPFIARI